MAMAMRTTRLTSNPHGRSTQSTKAASGCLGSCYSAPVAEYGERYRCAGIDRNRTRSIVLVKSACDLIGIANHLSRYGFGPSASAAHRSRGRRDRRQSRYHGVTATDASGGNVGLACA